MPDTTKIHARVIIKIMGVFLMIISLMMALGLIFSYVYDEPDKQALILSSAITFTGGLLLFLLNRRADFKEINKRDGFVIVSLTWVVISLFGTLPFLLSGAIDNFTDAFFETMSGFTTTGATILTDIESVSKGVLYWRSVTQWIGGMGVIVLALAIMPVLGVGGMQLYIAEMPGPTKDKLHPRITETAKRLWGIYVLLTVIQALIMFAAGMDVFDSVCHSFTTMATGGFSTKNESMAAFSPFIQYVVIVFMFLAGTSFVLLYYALHLKFSKVWESEEFRSYVYIVVVSTLVITGSLIISSSEPFSKAFRDALFQTIAIKTTTGYVTTDYMLWQPFTWYIIFLLMFVGACAGSTSGGVKVVRQIILFKNSRLEMQRLIHPKAIIPVKLNGKTIPENIINNVLAFFVIYILIFGFSAFFMSMLGLDFDTALGSVAATIGNVGPGIGKVGPVENYSFIPAPGKWLLSFLMLIGRLELFTVLVLFTATFWKR